MKRQRSANDGQKFIDDITAKQRNVVWPDTLRNGRAVDKFLWNGSPNAPLVQRIGAWIFGLTFSLAGVAFLGVARTDGSWPWALSGLGLILLGAKVFGNGFRRRTSKARSKDT
jgi:hypothetical protein